jgi:hypothetical protein
VAGVWETDLRRSAFAVGNPTLGPRQCPLRRHQAEGGDPNLPNAFVDLQFFNTRKSLLLGPEIGGLLRHFRNHQIHSQFDGLNDLFLLHRRVENLYVSEPDLALAFNHKIEFQEIRSLPLFQVKRNLT